MDIYAPIVTGAQRRAFDQLSVFANNATIPAELRRPLSRISTFRSEPKKEALILGLTFQIN